jgi:hypothetical protein
MKLPRWVAALAKRVERLIAPDELDEGCPDRDKWQKSLQNGEKLGVWLLLCCYYGLGSLQGKIG